MPIIARQLLAAAALLLGSAATAEAYDDSPSQGRELTCSALCRSWMNLGAVEAPTAPAAAPVQASQAVLAAPMAAKSAALAAPVGSAPKRVVAAHHAVPLPVPRPAQMPARRVVAEADVRPVATRAPADATASPVPSPAPSPAAALPPVDVPAGLVQATPVQATPVQATPAPVAHVAVASVVADGPTPPAAMPRAPEAIGAQPVATRSAMATSETPLIVKLGFYALLAALVRFGLRPRRTVSGEGAPERRRGRETSREFGRRLDVATQNAGVDAL